MAHCPSLRSESCVNCRVRELCLPGGVDSADAQRLANLIPQRMKIRKGAALFHPADPLRFIYVVHHGFFKTSFLSADGREQLTGFQMSADLLGIDAISSGRYTCDAIALEDSEVCPIHFSQLEVLSRELPSLHHKLNRILSQEVVRNQQLLMWMGNLNAEERLGAFLLDLSARMQERGYSPHAFLLRMTREDIAAHLGLRLETVCRAIAYLRGKGLVRISGRAVEIVSHERLKALGTSGSTPRKLRLAPVNAG
ncbi:helix-turn-helix domain-containing protein [Pseudomonas sp. JUb42]|uniref:helix-turn-helix domain-containing protein n=1 Tax=Pseudomonas sp. JUb42 TaxID=2940611 RepID=UPI002167EA7F|nr:helix-turn-helix domain-containing protein [Pseudomonas sp. JUb42]